MTNKPQKILNDDKTQKTHKAKENNTNWVFEESSRELHF